MTIVWFRSDLRIHDNPALNAAMHDGAKGVRAVVYICEKQWLEHDWGRNKIGFVLASILSLEGDLANLNIPLDIRYCDYFKEIAADLLQYLNVHKSDRLFFNKEYELNERKRDEQVTSKLNANNVKVEAFHDQTLIPPGVILTKQNTPYTVFTPFKKACYNYLLGNDFIRPAQIKLVAKAKLFKSHVKVEYQHYLDNQILKLWPAGESVAHKLLQEFCTDKIAKYDQQRDFPALGATSKLSPYLAVGSISVKQCFMTAIAHNNHDAWLNELIWRDFYRNIMFHFPNICKGENFNSKYNKLRWENPLPNLEKWQQGQTGIPIVDAAMRQLVSTGWMHNRLRMIVAMFLTKNLLIDWRHGEKFFAQHLIDLDLASNNGGWQWSASTGTDAVPYFRVFNPITQAKKFDPQEEFIKEYCPEYKSNNYPRPIIDLAKSRARALERFSASNLR